MKPIICLLDANNNHPAFGPTVAERIAALGKEHLWNDRPAGARINTIVLHYMSTVEDYDGDPFDFEKILAVFCKHGVSSHYLIARDGSLFLLVPEEMRAWHAGGSIMPEPDNRTNVNDFSLGIELVALHASGYTDDQYAVLAQLCREVESRYPGQCSYAGHSDIAGERAVALGLRPKAKIDPGPLFDWNRFFLIKAGSVTR